VWRHARRRAKRACEMTARKSAHLRYIRYEDIIAQVAREILLCALFLKNRKSTRPNDLAFNKPTIPSTWMRHDCERDLIDEQRGSLFGTFEIRKKSASQTCDKRIPRESLYQIVVAAWSTNQTSSPTGPYP
jgi:hypothetical protein